MSTYVNRAERLWGKQQRDAGYVADWQFYTLRISPSCPPDKRIHMRAGHLNLSYNPDVATWDDWEYRAYTVPSLIAEIDDPDSVMLEVSFSNAGYYQLFLLQLKLPGVVEEPTATDWSFLLHGTGAEFATAHEAELWMNSEDFQYSQPWMSFPPGPYGPAYPLCGLVLRNDGQIDIAGAFLPVDMVNRGRSYIWPRDMRPRQPMRT